MAWNEPRRAGQKFTVSVWELPGVRSREAGTGDPFRVVSWKDDASGPPKLTLVTCRPVCPSFAIRTFRRHGKVVVLEKCVKSTTGGNRFKVAGSNPAARRLACSVRCWLLSAVRICSNKVAVLCPEEEGVADRSSENEPPASRFKGITLEPCTSSGKLRGVCSCDVDSLQHPWLDSPVIGY